MTLSPLSFDDLLAELDIGAFEPHHQRHLQPDLLDRGDHAFGDDVAFHDAAEDVDENAFDGRVGGDDLEGGRHLVLRGAAADIEKVSRLGAVELDDVHRRHGEAGAVDHAADIAVERDIGEIELRGLDLLRVLFRDVAQLGQVRDGGTARCCRTRSWRRAHAAGRSSARSAGSPRAGSCPSRQRPCRASGTASRRPLPQSPDSFSAALSTLISRSVTPFSGSMATVTIFSGVSWATPSMSIPPSVETTKAMRPTERSTRIDR